MASFSDENASSKATVKISPTYQSTDLMAPLRVPPTDTVPSRYIISDGIRSWNSTPNPSWSTYLDDYGGIGGLPFLGKKRVRREDILVPRSHRHFLSSTAKMIHDKVQPKNITPFVKSKLRQHDEMIAETTVNNQHELMKEQNQLKKEVPEFCFIAKTDMFPKTQLEYEAGPSGRRYRYVNKRTLEELEKLVKGRNYSSYQLDFPLPPTAPSPPKSKRTKELQSCQQCTCSEKNAEENISINKSSENVIKGLWPCWPASGNHIISNLTGQIVEKHGQIIEKRDVVSLDDKRDCRIQSQSSSSGNQKQGSAISQNAIKLIRPKTPRRLLTRPKSPYFKHKNYINRVNQLVEETARRKHIQLNSDKAQWTWYTGQNLEFLQQEKESKPNEEKDESTNGSCDDENVAIRSESNCFEKNIMKILKDDALTDENKETGVLGRKRDSNHAVENFVKRAKVHFDVADQHSEEVMPRVPSRSIDPFGISLDLDGAVGTLTDLYNSVSARQAKDQAEMKNCRVFKFKNVQLPELNDQPMKLFDEQEVMEFEEELDPLCTISTSERLGPRFKTIIVKEHQKHHSSLVPDLRDFRPTIRKSHWLGHHTSVFR